MFSEATKFVPLKRADCSCGRDSPSFRRSAVFCLNNSGDSLARATQTQPTSSRAEINPEKLSPHYEYNQVKNVPGASRPRPAESTLSDSSTPPKYVWAFAYKLYSSRLRKAALVCCIPHKEVGTGKEECVVVVTSAVTHHGQRRQNRIHQYIINMYLGTVRQILVARTLLFARRHREEQLLRRRHCPRC